jgi:hypothetical protein
MEKASFYARLFLSFSLVCISVSTAYFSYALLQTIQEIPDIINGVDNAAQSMGPVVKETEKITALIPKIVEEVSMVREQIPAILAEVEALREKIPSILAELEKTRDSIPSILAEMEQVRLAIPPVINEVANVRGQIPSIVAESQGYRLLIPDVLAEVDATRAIITPTMDRAEQLISEASIAGQQASEGAVTGFFTGIIKAPFKVVSGASDSVFGSTKNLSTKEKSELTELALDMLNDSKVGSVEPWGSQRSGVTAEATLLRDFQRDGRLCRVLEITTFKKKKLLERSEIEACMDESQEWVVKQK